MKAFTVTSEGITKGLLWEKEPYPHVPIGEDGRGRKLYRFPVGRKFAEAIDRRIDRASVIKTREKGTLLLVEEKDQNDHRALVKLAVEAGYRGGAKWTSAAYRIEPCQLRGKTMSIYDVDLCERKCYSCGTEVHKKALGEYLHPEDGTVRVYEPLSSTPGVTILAEGYCAQGTAGRMGGHPEYLILIGAGTTLRVARSGRLYGDPAVQYLHWTGEDLRFGTYDVVFPPVDEEVGEVI
ncbi:hypothetical protein BSNK01_12130 [Bacillaceae bacterium]